MATSDEAVIVGAREEVLLFERNVPQTIQSDAPSWRDTLGVGSVADALAETLILHHVAPPITVGIFGSWGSGKTTFMRLMHQRMAKIRALPVTRGWSDDSGDRELSSFAGHLYQIWFNAWNYAKSNLWASLMQQIFSELNRQLAVEDHLYKEGYDPLEGGLSTTDLLAHRSVARVSRRAGGHEVADAGEPEERSDIGPARATEACDLDDAARQERTLRVVSQLQAVTDSGGDGDDVLERTGELGAVAVRRRVDAERFAVEGALYQPAVLLVLASGHDGRGQVSRDLLRMARTREHTDRSLSQDPPEDLAGCTEGLDLQAFRRGDDRDVSPQRVLELERDLADELRGNGRHDEVHTVRGGERVGAGAEVLGERESGQVGLVGAVLLHRSCLLGEGAPDDGVDAIPSESDREGRSPGSVADDQSALDTGGGRFTHDVSRFSPAPSRPVGGAFLPIRVSLPSRIRAMLMRCLRMMSNVRRTHDPTNAG